MGKGILDYEVGQQLEAFLLVKSAAKATASNGKPFLTLILQDQSGDIEAKLWDATDEDVKHYGPEKYCKNLGEIQNRLENDAEQIQCIVSNNLIENSIPFGKTQKPELWDYADNVDTMEFLMHL